MTTALDTRLLPRIKAIIASRGKTVVYKVESGKTIDKTDGSSVAGTTTNYTVKVTPPAPPKNSSVFANRIGPELDRRGMSEFMIAAQSLEFIPKTGNVVVIDSDEWTVEAVDPVRTGDEIGAYWVLVVR